MSPKERFTRELERKDARARAEGRVEGREEGKRDLLLNLLRLKFGDLPARVAEKVAAAGREQVEAWAARVLTAATLDSVFTAG